MKIKSFYTLGIMGFLILSMIEGCTNQSLFKSKSKGLDKIKQDFISLTQGDTVSTVRGKGKLFITPEDYLRLDVSIKLDNPTAKKASAVQLLFKLLPEKVNQTPKEEIARKFFKGEMISITPFKKNQKFIGRFRLSVDKIVIYGDYLVDKKKINTIALLVFLLGG